MVRTWITTKYTKLSTVTRRRLYHILMATPALIGLLAVVWLMAGFAMGVEDQAAKYAKLTEEAKKNTELQLSDEQMAKGEKLTPEESAKREKSLKTALLYAEKTVQLSPQPRYVLTLAELCLEDGDRKRGEELLRGLANNNEPLAHLSLAKSILKDPQLSEEQVRTVKNHLERAASVAVSTEVAYETAKLFLKTQHPERVKDLLRKCENMREMRIAKICKERADEALKDRDIRKALGYTLRAADYSPDPDHIFNQAEILLLLAEFTQREAARAKLTVEEAKRKETEVKNLFQRAVELLRFLAPENRPDSPGDPRAHYRVGALLLNYPNTFELAKTHLQAAEEAKGFPNAPDATYLLAQAYMRTQPLNKGNKDHLALAAFRRLPSIHPGKVHFAEVLAQLDERIEAEAVAKSCESLYQNRLTENSKDLQSRILLARSQSVLRKFDPAIRRLNEGIDIEKDEQGKAALAIARANVFRAWLAFLRTGLPVTINELFQVLDVAIHATPTDSDLLNILVNFSNPRTPEGTKARAMLNDRIAKGQGQDLALAHFVLGNLYSIEGNQQQALLHMQKANDAQSGNPRFVYNLANNLSWLIAHNEKQLDMATAAVSSSAISWAIAQKEKPQLDRAIALIDPAVKADPENTDYRHTRGVILHKLKRWDAVISDLEKVLKSQNPKYDLYDLHIKLADAYEGSGDKTLAESHRKLANEMRPPTKE